MCSNFALDHADGAPLEHRALNTRCDLSTTDSSMILQNRFLTVSFVALFAIGMSACDGTSGTAPGAGGTTGVDGGSGFQVVDGQSTGGTGDVAVVPDTVDVAQEPELLPGQICPPSVGQCVDDDLRRECLADGTEWVETLCGSAKKCWQGQCSDVICSPGVLKSECGSPTALLTCNKVGTHFIQTPCDGGKTCFKGKCVNYLCQPDAVACVGFGAVQQCRSDGSGWDVIEQCEKGGTCDNGSCVSACDVDLKAATYTGCEYFAVDLDNIEGGQFEPVAIVVSVPATVENSVVSIRNMATGSLLTPFELNALSWRSFAIRKGNHCGCLWMRARRGRAGRYASRVVHRGASVLPQTGRQSDPSRHETI
jgi:hypothetical protein